MANSWYAYLGQGKDPYVNTSYKRVTIDPLCLNGCTICAIYLLGETLNPPSILSVTTLNMQKYITDSLVAQSPQPNGLGVKHFVYLKGCY